MRQKGSSMKYPGEDLMDGLYAEDGRQRQNITSRDIIARLKFNSSFGMVYVGAVGLAATLFFVALLTDEVHSIWYITSEAFLTLLFALEVLVQIWLSGPAKYFTQSNANILEFLLCVSCCMIFGLSVTQRFARLEFEAFLLTLRYSAQLARIYFFIKSQRQAAASQRKVVLHEHDNPGITIHNGPNYGNTSPAHAWQQEHELSSDLLKEIV